ncbi:MAG: MFS transporter [Oscillospiraceae bacterium]|nr:MFS transporter [Oscillospiraceae bacterium]
MKKTKKERSPEAVGFKEIFGVTALQTNNGLAAIFMSTMFMNYMTDYAGLGTWGATLATTLLLAARIIDAVDDPIQGFIMDSGKVGKHGKYKPFFLLSIIMTGLGVIALYSLPDAITKAPWLVTIWVIFFYFVYDIGASFYNQNLLYRTMTSDPEERGKLLIGPRLWVMILGMLGSAMTTVLVSIQTATGSYKTAYMILAGVSMGISCVVSFIGWLLCKEKHVVEQDEEDKVKFSDFIDLMKTNKAMMIDFFKNIFSGFIWTFLFAAPSYYVKWAYCADPATGAVDMEKLGTYSMIVSLMMLFPLLVGTIVANPLLKAFKGDIVRMHRFDLLMQGVGGLIMFIGQLLGVLQSMPAVFFASMFVMATFIGIDFIPGSSIGMEIMDYTIYKTGKDRSALTGVLGKFLEKAQNAVSSALVGLILIAVGYNVDSVTGNYIGELSKFPTMLTGLTVVIGLLPALMAIISVLILRKYPIDQEEREKMRAYIAEHQSKKVEE